MGAVTAIFLVPLFLPFMLIMGLFDTAFGIGIEKVVLPYDEESGVVWEYREGDEAFVDCIKTTVKDGQQIFTFRGKGVLDDGNPESYQNEEFVDALYFVDADGNVKTYYAMLDFGWDGLGIDDGSMTYGSMDIYEESECVIFEYTVKPVTEVEGYYWHEYDHNTGYYRNRYVGLPDIENMHERTYKFVLPPEDIKDGTFDMSFHYRPEYGKQYDKIDVTFEMVGREVNVIEEKHYIWVDVDEDTFRWEEVV